MVCQETVSWANIFLSYSGTDHGIAQAQTLFPEPASTINIAMDFDIGSIYPGAVFHRLAVVQKDSQWRGETLYSRPDTENLLVRWNLLIAEDRE